MNFFKYLTKDELNMYTYTTSYKAGDIIFNEEEICSKIGILEKGEAIIVTITHTEKEEPITYLTTDSMFGDLLVFASNNIYLGHCICKKDSLVRYISKENLMKLFNTNNKVLNSYLMNVSNKAQSIKKENKILKHNNLEDRIIHYLLEESLVTKSNIVKIKNITSLGSILSISRESLSRCIRSLINKEYIVMKKKGQTCYIKLLLDNIY